MLRKYRGKDQIKTTADVRRAVQKTAPSRGKVLRLSSTMTTNAATIAPCLSLITFSNEDSRQDRRQSMKITLSSFHMRFNLFVGDDTNLVRILVGRHKGLSDTATFDPTACFYNDGQTIPIAVYSQINTRYFEPLYDRTWNMQARSTEYPTRPENFFVDDVVRIDKLCTYKPVADGQTPLPRNNSHYYIIGVSDSSITPNPSIEGNGVIWFKNVE